jgi:hypothetical protein
MIRFIKELYLASFALVYRISRQPDVAIRTGAAIAPLVLIQCLNITNIQSCIEIYFGKKGLFDSSRLTTLAIFSTFAFINSYFLVIRGYGTKFVHEFDKLEKSRRILLTVSCVFLLLATVVFTIWSGLAYRHFIGIG